MDFSRFQPLFDIIEAELARCERTVLAIDGAAASGKSTLAAFLAEKYGADVEKIIQTYIQSERESVEALAALYPAEELSARLARFDGATVKTVGLTTYYVIADAKIVKKTENLFKN